MPRIPSISSNKIIKILQMDGFTYGKPRQRGSHLAFHKKTPEGIKLVVVQADRKDIPIGTLRDIIRKAGMSRDRFFELLEMV